MEHQVPGHRNRCTALHLGLGELRMAKSEFPRKVSSVASVSRLTAPESALFGIYNAASWEEALRTVDFRSTVPQTDVLCESRMPYLTPASEPVKTQKHSVAKHAVECKAPTYLTVKHFVCIAF